MVPGTWAFRQTNLRTLCAVEPAVRACHAKVWATEPSQRVCMERRMLSLVGLVATSNSLWSQTWCSTWALRPIARRVAYKDYLALRTVGFFVLHASVLPSTFNKRNCAGDSSRAFVPPNAAISTSRFE